MAHLVVLSISLSTYLVVTKLGCEMAVTVPRDSRTVLDCDVLIIGTGFAGSFAAYSLAPQYGKGLCVIERNARDGGRILDVSEYPGGPVFAMGAKRIMSGQTAINALAHELGIPLEVVGEETELLKSRGSKDGKSSTITGMLEALTALPGEELVEHADFATLLRWQFGEEGKAYFDAATPIRYNGGVSSAAILDRIAANSGRWSSTQRSVYPIGGMSEFITRMQVAGKAAGMRVFHSEPALAISTSRMGFSVDTPRLVINTPRILSSMDPLAFQGVSGNVAESVKMSVEFQGIVSVPWVTVTAWWNERWWEQSELYGNRTFTAVSSYDSCFREMDIAVHPYARRQNATRVVYDRGGGGTCIDMWRLLIGSGEEPASEQLIREVLKDLQQVFYDVHVPRPRTVKGFIFNNGGHIQHARSTKTNHEVLQWSMRPTPYTNFALIGEAYNIRKNYKGCLVKYPHYLTLDEVEKFQASPLDVAVCSVQKSGTTWMDSIISGILADGDPGVYNDGVSISIKFPLLCFCKPNQRPEEWLVNLMKLMPPGRTFNTHLSYDALPASLTASGAKKVYIYRNPKDTVVATYYHNIFLPRMQFNGDLADVVDSFVKDRFAFGPYFEHLASYWKRRHEDANIFFCSFEDLKNDFEKTVARLAQYLGKSLTAEQIAVIHRETDFKAAQGNRLLNRSDNDVHAGGIFDLSKHLFVRNGSVGQWKKEFTPEMNSKMDAWIDRKMTQFPELQDMKFVYE
ncbi:putative Sulfotransferase family cytosolic 1B member 1 [Hypsibius exemplaris]|uniref:Sulfotransferase family cytosolic 1B member 1 n=1 Tax=Hypsibius exemplaris TaxID=2072580 RepID=A0A9X6RKH9_HYPEX|nr:putative Sulfotransferase family cytosolic 1B member 1 [Hypsibius exemplaris]